MNSARALVYLKGIIFLLGQSLHDFQKSKRPRGGNPLSLKKRFLSFVYLPSVEASLRKHRPNPRGAGGYYAGTGLKGVRCFIGGLHFQGPLFLKRLLASFVSPLAQAKTRGIDPALSIGFAVIRSTPSICGDNDTAGGSISGLGWCSRLLQLYEELLCCQSTVAITSQRHSGL